MLSTPVRALVVKQVSSVEKQMKNHYSNLYNDDFLPLELLTPGHAANSDVKTEFNIYLRANNNIVPASPFSNAGRIRALCLAFMFALIENSKGSIGILLLDDPIISLDDEHRSRFMDSIISSKIQSIQVMLTTHNESFFKISEVHFDDDNTLELVPRKKSQGFVSVEPGTLLQKLDAAFQEGGLSWKAYSMNLRRWIERVLMSISGYSPEPFFAYNNLPLSIENYEKHAHPNLATDDRAALLAAIKSHKLERVRNIPAHESDTLIESDVRDALKTLSEDAVKPYGRILSRLKELHKHRIVDRMIDEEVYAETLVLNNANNYNLTVTGQAAAASEGVGVLWEEKVAIKLDNIQQAILKSETLSPVAKMNHFLFLDSEDSVPENGDLVIAKTSDDKKYARRFWKENGQISLESINITDPMPPIVLTSGTCQVCKIIGVFFNQPGSGLIKEGEEWGGCNRSFPFPKIKGIRAVGTSMEPIARNGQIVLVHDEDARENVGENDLVCVDGEDLSPVIKRCFPQGDNGSYVQ